MHDIGIYISHIKNVLLDRQFCFPHPLQFDFKTDHCDVPACYFIKVIIGWPVFCTFLENKKAFDRI